MAKNNLKSEVVDLSDNTRGAWLGDKSADTIILWLHGTFPHGYLQPLSSTVTNRGNSQQVADMPFPWALAICS